MLIIYGNNIRVYWTKISFTIFHQGIYSNEGSDHRYGYEKKAIVIEVILGRRLLSTILTVYTPTLLLNVIGHSTNFFKGFFFEAVITVTRSFFYKHQYFLVQPQTDA